MSESLILRQWQEEAALELIDSQRGILKAGTGSGKTVVALACIRDISYKLNIILVPTVHLMNQWYDEVQKHLGIRPTLKGGGRNEPITKINIWVMNTAQKILPTIKSQDYVLVIDECHRAASPKNKEMIQSISPHYILGLSATPERADEDISKIIGPIVYNYTFKDGIRDGFLRPVEVNNIGYRMSREEQLAHDDFSLRKKNIEKRLGVFAPPPVLINKMKRDFRRRGATEKATLCDQWLMVCQERKRALFVHMTRMDLTMDIISKNPGRKILVVGESIPVVEELHSRLMVDVMNNYTPVKEHSQLSDKERKLAIRRFKEQDNMIMISARTLDQGADFPDVDMVLIHSSSSNVLQFIQRIGRGVRPSGADVTLVYRPFALDTSDDIAIKELINSDVLDRDCIKVIEPDNTEVHLKDRKRMKKMSLLSGDYIRHDERSFKASSDLAGAIRVHKPKGGVFYWEPLNKQVVVNLGGKWIMVGVFDIKIPDKKDKKEDWGKPLAPHIKQDIMDYLGKFSDNDWQEDNA